jgi:hypothetical protein
MREFSESLAVEVLDSEYNRLLGLPPDFIRAERVEELAQWARGWYKENGRPWVFTRLAERFEIGSNGFSVEGVRFTSDKALERLRNAKAHSCILVAVGAGVETEIEAQNRWEMEHPDEYFFLEMYGSAVVEHLLTLESAKICAWADSQGWAALPHYSPGYTGWDLSDQAALFGLVAKEGAEYLGERLQLLSSGMLRPRKSQIAIIGVTNKGDIPPEIEQLIPCEDCAFSPCAFRRAPYKWRIYVEGAGRNGNVSSATVTASPAETSPSPLSREVQYAFSEKVLDRWARERLELEEKPQGEIQARFRYEGSTCNNLGFPIQMEYRIRLSAASEGYRILETICSPAEDDEGFEKTCSYLNNLDAFSSALKNEHPLLGRSLAESPEWAPASFPSGCWCTRMDRDHKWKVVFQTLHYKLANYDKQTA